MQRMCKQALCHPRISILCKAQIGQPKYPNKRAMSTRTFLRFAYYLFGFALGLQLGIIGYLLGHFLDLTLRFAKRSFRLIPNARFHGTHSCYYFFMHNTADTFSCLSQNRQLFCNAFYKEVCRLFCDKNSESIHPARKSPLCMEYL